MTTTDNAVSQAHAQIEEIERLISTRDELFAAGDDDGADEIRTEILENALSVQVRADWYSPGSTDARCEPSEFQILLCTGGPAVQIVGTLNRYQEPETVDLQAQDWYTPWESVPLTDAQETALMAFCGEFYYGG